MANISFTKATKTGLYARLALVGPAGSGKTMSALRIARGLVGETGRIALLDTEHGSASKYAGKSGHDFDSFCPDNFSPQVYIDAIHAAESGGYNAFVVDSLSHAWAGKGGALEMVDAAKSRNSGNSFTAWRDVTPLHNQLVETMLSCKLHLIVTMRSKIEYVVEEYEERGKKRTRITKMGLQPIQREGLDYEFDIVGDLDTSHNFVVSKTRCASLDGRVFPLPGDDVASEILAWLSDSEPVKTSVAKPQPTTDPRTPLYNAIKAFREENGIDKDRVAKFIHDEYGCAITELPIDTLADIPGRLLKLVENPPIETPSLADDPDVIQAFADTKTGNAKQTALLVSARDNKWSKDQLLSAIRKNGNGNGGVKKTATAPKPVSEYEDFSEPETNQVPEPEPEPAMIGGVRDF